MRVLELNASPKLALVKQVVLNLNSTQSTKSSSSRNIKKCSRNANLLIRIVEDQQVTLTIMFKGIFNFKFAPWTNFRFSISFCKTLYGVWEFWREKVELLLDGSIFEPNVNSFWLPCPGRADQCYQDAMLIDLRSWKLNMPHYTIFGLKQLILIFQKCLKGELSKGNQISSTNWLKIGTTRQSVIWNRIVASRSTMFFPGCCRQKYICLQKIPPSWSVI